MLPAMPAVRIVAFGDTHLGFDMPAKARIERRRRGDDFAANFHRVLGHAAGRADVLVHLGDFFHRSRVPDQVVDDAFTGLAKLADAGLPVVIVPGNHDRSRLPASLWLGHPNIHVFERPRTVTLEARGARLAFAGFPFAWGNLRTAFPRLAEESAQGSAAAHATFLCMHHTVEGARVGPNGYTFRGGKDVIRRADLPGHFAAVLSGHIHRHQLLHGDHPTVYYPGSTERTSFAERDERKGFLELEVEVRADGPPSLAHTFVELPARPMVDLALPAAAGESELRPFLARAAAALPCDAVVRLVSPEDDTGRLLELVTAELLRAVFPPGMNVQLAGGWFRRGRD